MKLPHGGYTPRISGRPISEVAEIAPPEKLRINIRRNGLMYLPVVANGKTVGLGEPLAEAVYTGGTLSLPSPASGTVSIDSKSPDLITLEGVIRDTGTGNSESFEPSRITGERTRSVLAAAGVWPFFWSSLSRNVPALDGSDQPKAILVNFVLAEPFRARGKVLLNHSWDRIVHGIKFLPRVLADYGKVEIVLTAIHDPVARRMYSELAGFAWIRLHPVPLKYPVEFPDVLRTALTRNVPSIKPEDVIWTIDVQGIEALGSCLGEGLPLHRRVVAIGGPGARNPRHVSVRIGTPVESVLGGDEDTEGNLVLRGGLFNGEVLDPATEAVRYDDDAFFLLPKSKVRETFSFLRPGFNRTSYLPAFISRITGAADRHITDSIRGERRPCIACGLCEKVCPAGILPQVLHRYLYREAFDEAERAGLDRCVECNLCTYICPSKIELRMQFTEAREQLREERGEDRQRAVEAGN